MIKPAQEELWAFNIINAQVTNVQAELGRCVSARDSYIKLLETKYDAVFNADKGQLEPKPKDSKTEEKL